MALFAVVAGLLLTSGQNASAGDFLFFHFEDDHSYSQPTYYAPQPQPTHHYQQPAQPRADLLQPVRETAGNAAELYMNLSPGAQIAESIGLLDRGFVLRLFRSR
jgi:hypothetical protein